MRGLGRRNGLAGLVLMGVLWWCSAVRKQGFSGAAGSSGARVELQVLDYPTQMHTLMPLLAWAYALQVGAHLFLL